MPQRSPKGGRTSLQASPSKPRFLLDENVKKKLLVFLASKQFDAKYAPKGTRNGDLADMCKTEQRVLVTNDTDFAETELFSRERLFSVVWLKIPQDDTKALLDSFVLLLEANPRPDDFEGKLIVMGPDKLEVSALPEKGK